MLSASTEAALQHLKRIKPLDGWSVETNKTNNVRLLRRNVPLTENYFLDLHHDSKKSNAVVGILSHPKDGGMVQAQVLVDSKGMPVRKIQLVSVSTWNGRRNNARPAAARSSATRSSTSTSTTAAAAAAATATSAASRSIHDNTLTFEQNQQLLKYAAYAVGALVLFRLVFQTMFLLYILAFPLAYLYLVSTCPLEDSFDVKKELKRVLRGHHLPENHPEKPKGFLSETMARIGASVSTELATSLGYEVTMVSLAGAAVVACVRVPSAQMDFYWIGAVHRWWYVYSAQVQNDKID